MTNINRDPLLRAIYDAAQTIAACYACLRDADRRRDRADARRDGRQRNEYLSLHRLGKTTALMLQAARELEGAAKELADARKAAGLEEHPHREQTK